MRNEMQSLKDRLDAMTHDYETSVDSLKKRVVTLENQIYKILLGGGNNPTHNPNHNHNHTNHSHNHSHNHDEPSGTYSLGAPNSSVESSAPTKKHSILINGGSVNTEGYAFLSFLFSSFVCCLSIGRFRANSNIVEMLCRIYLVKVL